jgi:hypothetical protein
MKKLIFCIVSFIFHAGINAQEVPKDMWIAQMKTALPEHFCSTEQYFRQCFNVQDSKCRTVAAEATSTCLNQFEKQIPNKLKQPADGTKWGAQIGMCAGNAYEAALSSQRISNAKCNNPNNWR